MTRNVRQLLDDAEREQEQNLHNAASDWKLEKRRRDLDAAMPTLPDRARPIIEMNIGDGQFFRTFDMGNATR
ncbi:MAG: hypothetical protein ABIK36_16260 [Pseudomonadota bacterium]